MANTAHEHATAKYTAIIKDESSVAIAAASLTTLTLTLYDSAGTIINSRNAQDVLNTNNVCLLYTSPSPRDRS